MFKKIACIAFILFYTNICSAQNEQQKILIYAENEDYLMPLIEKKLSEIKYLGKDNNIFNKVTNLNRITSNIANEQILNNAIKYHSGLNIRLTDSMKRVQNSIVDLIKKNDLFLQVKINTLNNLLEYQFFLYKISPTNFPIIDTTNPISTFNTFIDVQNGNYSKKIEDAIKAIFPKSNSKPIALIDVIGFEPFNEFLDKKRKISDEKKERFIQNDRIIELLAASLKYDEEIKKSNKKIEQLERESKILDQQINNIKSKDYTAEERTNFWKTYQGIYKKDSIIKENRVVEMKQYYIPLNTDVQLSPFKSSDQDTPKEFLSYSWKIIDNQEPLLSSDFQMKLNQGECILKFFSEKSTKIVLIVNDGIFESTDTIIVSPVKKRILYIPPTKREFTIFDSKPLFRFNSNNIYDQNYYNISILTEKPSEINLERIILSTVSLSFDTLNIINSNRPKKDSLKKDHEKVKYLGFSLIDDRINLNFSHLKNSEGKYRVNYYDKGIIYKSNDISIKRVQIGFFSIGYLYNFSNLLGKKFNESEYSISCKISQSVDIYTSLFYGNTLTNSDSLNIKNSYELGIKVVPINILTLRKNVLYYSTGFFVRNYDIQSLNESILKTQFGSSMNLSLWGVINERFKYNITAGVKRYLPQKSNEIIPFLGIGLSF
jgi:hypothetical protein